jgi:hypothetical protein
MAMAGLENVSIYGRFGSASPSMPYSTARQRRSISAPARGTCSVDFVDLRHFEFAAPAIQAFSPLNVIATPNQKSRLSSRRAPRS